MSLLPELNWLSSMQDKVSGSQEDKDAAAKKFAEISSGAPCCNTILPLLRP